MGPELIAVETDAAPPKRADVVVIGGGIAGVSTLLSLAEKGVSAVLVEKGHLAGEQSSRNWGFCRTQGRDMAEVPLAIESLRQWDRMAERVGAEVGFTRAGACYLCETPKEVAAYEAGWRTPVSGRFAAASSALTRSTAWFPAPAAVGPARYTPTTTAARSHNWRCL